MILRGRFVAMPRPGAAAAGTLPSTPGDKLVIVVALETIGAGRNIGATDVRQPQYLSSLPRKIFKSAFCDSSSTAAGGADVVEKVSSPPLTSEVSVTTILVPALRCP